MDSMRQFGQSFPKVADDPIQWLIDWRTTIVIVGMALFSWALWWQDSLRSARATRAAEAAQLVAREEQDPERIAAVNLVRSTISNAMKKPLTLEEESVSLHNLRLAVAKAAA